MSDSSWFPAVLDDLRRRPLYNTATETIIMAEQYIPSKLFPIRVID